MERNFSHNIPSISWLTFSIEPKQSYFIQQFSPLRQLLTCYLLAFSKKKLSESSDQVKQLLKKENIKFATSRNVQIHFVKMYVHASYF